MALDPLMHTHPMTGFITKVTETVTKDDVETGTVVVLDVALQLSGMYEKVCAFNLSNQPPQEYKYTHF